MNKIEIQTLIRRGLRQHAGTEYGDISGVETVSPSPADPAPHLIVSAPDPLGQTRLFRVEVTEISVIIA